MADDRIEIEITLDDGSVRTGFAKVAKEAAATGKKIERSFDITGSLRNSFSLLRTEVLALGTAFVGALASKAAIEAAARQEEAINQLNTSLRTAGSFSEEASQSIQDFASQLQETTTIGDETSIELVALARNFARSNAEAVELTKTAIDLSAATGISLDSAVRNLGKTFSGLTGELGEAVPEVRALTKEQLIAGDAITVLAERFQGAANDQIKTFSGALAQLNNSFGDFLEGIGGIVTRSPALVSVFNTISQAFIQSSKSLGEFAQSGDILAPLLLKFITFAQGLNNFFVAPIQFATRTAILAFNGLRAGVQKVISGMASLLARAASFFAPNSDLAKGLNSFKESSSELLDQFSNDARASVDSFFNPTTSEKINAFLETLRAGVQATSGQFRKLSVDVSNSVKSVTSTTGEEGKKIVEIGVNVADFFNKIFPDAVVGGFAAVGGALASGANAFEAFGKTALGFIGDFAIQLGTFIIKSVLAVDALKKSLFTFGLGGGLLAGGALVALGTALKAFAGGPAGIGATPTGGGAAPDTEPVFTPVFEDDEITDAAQQSVGNVINITGAIDPKSTALQIRDLLQDSFDEDGGGFTFSTV